MKTGFGFILCNLGSLLFLLVFHCKLHTIPENSPEVILKKYLKFSLCCFLLGLGVLLQQIFFQRKKCCLHWCWGASLFISWLLLSYTTTTNITILMLTFDPCIVCSRHKCLSTLFDVCFK